MSFMQLRGQIISDMSETVIQTCLESTAQNLELTSKEVFIVY